MELFLLGTASQWQRKLRMGRDETRASKGEKGNWEPAGKTVSRFPGKPLPIIAAYPLL